MNCALKNPFERGATAVPSEQQFLNAWIEEKRLEADLDEFTVE